MGEAASIVRENTQHAEDSDAWPKLPVNNHMLGQNGEILWAWDVASATNSDASRLRLSGSPEGSHTWTVLSFNLMEIGDLF